MSLEHSTKLGVKSLPGASLALKSLAQLDEKKIGLNYALVMLWSEQN